MIMRVWKQGYNKDVVQGKTHTLSFSLMFDNFQTSSNSTSCAHMYVAHDKHVYNYIARKSLDTEKLLYTQQRTPGAQPCEQAVVASIP